MYKFSDTMDLDNIQWSYNLNSEAKNIGFYWTSTDQILDKITSEVTEIREAMAQQESKERVGEEIGDLYLAVLKLCHYLTLDPDTILQNSLKKFDQRLNLVKDSMKKRGITYFDAASKNIALELWHEAKKDGAVEED